MMYPFEAKDPTCVNIKHTIDCYMQRNHSINGVLLFHLASAGFWLRAHGYLYRSNLLAKWPYNALKMSAR